MPKSRSLAAALTAGACFAWLSSFAATAVAGPTPSNEELYRMILELQAAQQRLVEDATRARAEAAQARQQLETTQQELEAARQELEARAPAPVAAGPSAGGQAAEREGGLVRESHLERGYTLFAEANVLRSTDSQLSYATLTTEGDTLFGDGSIKPVQAEYQAGYKIGLGYDFGGPVDASFSYQGYHANNSGKLTLPLVSGENTFVGLIALLSPPAFGQDALAATGNADLKYHSVDAEIGENLDVGDHLGMRIFGGVRYTHAFQHFKARYYGGDFPTDVGTPLKCDANDCGIANTDFGFWGVGPRVGASGRYRLPWGFSLFGQVAGALLVGEKESETGLTTDGETEHVAFIHQDYSVGVSPELDMRAGVGWGRDLGEWGRFSLDVGYEFQNYFNVFERLIWNEATAPASVSENTSNFGLDGIYVRSALKFNGP